MYRSRLQSARGTATDTAPSMSVIRMTDLFLSIVNPAIAWSVSCVACLRKTLVAWWYKHFCSVEPALPFLASLSSTTFHNACTLVSFQLVARSVTRHVSHLFSQSVSGMATGRPFSIKACYFPLGLGPENTSAPGCLLQA